MTFLLERGTSFLLERGTYPFHLFHKEWSLRMGRFMSSLLDKSLSEKQETDKRCKRLKTSLTRQTKTN
jgi:hypothetical protein